MNLRYIIFSCYLTFVHGGWVNFPESCEQIMPENAYEEMCDDNFLIDLNSIEYHSNLKMTKEFCALAKIKFTSRTKYTCFNISISSLCNNDLVSQSLNQTYAINKLSNKECMEFIIDNWNSENLERSFIDKSEDLYRTRCNFMKNKKTDIMDYIILRENVESPMIYADEVLSVLETKLMELKSNTKLENTIKFCAPWNDMSTNNLDTLNLIGLGFNLCLAKNSFNIEKCLTCYLFIGHEKWFRDDDGFMLFFDSKMPGLEKIPICSNIWYRLFPGDVLKINQVYLSSKVKDRNRGCNAIKAVLKSGKIPPLNNMIKYVIPLKPGYGIGFREKIEKTTYSAPLRGNLVERRNYDFFRCHYFPSKVEIVENSTLSPPVNLCVYHYGKPPCHYPRDEDFIFMKPVTFDHNEHYPKQDAPYDYKSGINGIRRKIKNNEYYIPDSFIMTMIYSSHIKSILEKTEVIETPIIPNNESYSLLQDYKETLGSSNRTIDLRLDPVLIPNITYNTNIYTDEPEESNSKVKNEENITYKNTDNVYSVNVSISDVSKNETKKDDIHKYAPPDKSNKTVLVINYDDKDYWHEEYNMWGLGFLSSVLLLILFYRKIKKK
nr:MAG: non-structural glycoprotein GNS [Obodhiang virus]